MGRPTLNVKPTVVRLTDAVRRRIAALVGDHRMAAFIRQAVDEKLERDEASGKSSEKPSGPMCGRATRITPDVVDELLRLVRDEAEGGEGLPVTQAAKRLGMSSTTAYAKMREREEDPPDDLGA